jgi:hypothetical protein
MKTEKLVQNIDKECHCSMNYGFADRSILRKYCRRAQLEVESSFVLLYDVSGYWAVLCFNNIIHKTVHVNKG